MGDLAVGLSILALLLVATFLKLAEAAIARTTKIKAHHLVDQKKPGAGRLLTIVQDPAPFMNVLLLLALLARVTGVVLASVWSVDHFGVGAEAVAIPTMTILLYMLAEIAPRTLAIQNTEPVALFVARPVYVLGVALRPLGSVMIAIANAIISPLPGRPIRKGPFVTEEEIRDLGEGGDDDENGDEDENEEDERQLIHSIFEFGDTVVREVMVPRTDMVTARTDAALDEVLEIIIEAGYSRIPIYEGDIDNVVGVLYAKDLLKRIHESRGDVKAGSLGRAPLFVPEQKKVAELLREMQKQHVHMAVVVDEYGGTAGLVTIEDLIEEIVGEIVDEYDQEEPLVEPVDEQTIRVDAKLPIDEVNELLNVELPHEEWDTVGGLVFGLTGRVPVPGETVQYDHLEFMTERVSGRRIQKVVIKKLDSPAEKSEGDEAESA
ncbi:MAG: HlyC/CorC family transporter [Actinobacteria bacterium]|nr:HlyC/CorC family transporter [Actinomycetota bacterium]